MMDSRAASPIAGIADFIAAMELEGIQPLEPIARRLSAGELIRFRCEGDGRGRQNGWAILYLDERPAGAFGNYRLGISRKWKAGDQHCLTPAERQRLQAEWKAAKERRNEERRASIAEAALDAEEMWTRAQPADRTHPYLVKKGLPPLGLRQIGERLLIPMFNGAGDLRNLQRILPDGTKRFLRGGQTEGLFGIIGRFSKRGERVCIGEGWATMAHVHIASGFPCIASFSSRNLSPVARLWWGARPDLDFVICADDDAHLIDHPKIRCNLGLKVAKAAAEEIGARLAVPCREAA